MTTENSLDLAAIRAKLKASKGKEYWRSLDELADTPQFRETLEREFPRLAAYWPDGVSRRAFLKLMGASFALAGLAACSPPGSKLVPYVRQPENIQSGRPLFFASAMPLGGYAMPVLVESNMGRPTKVEGNPESGASLGATDVYAQASVLNLYDPERMQTLTQDGRITTWDQFSRALTTAIDAQKAKQGAGLRVLTQTVTSPTLAAQLKAMIAALPQAKWVQYEPLSANNAYAGAQLAFGRAVETIYNLDRADVILSLDADFMGFGPGKLRYARDWARRRATKEGPGGMNRAYVVESMPSISGMAADNRLPMRASDVEAYARAVAVAIGAPVDASASLPASIPAKWVTAVARDLQEHRGRSVVIAGAGQPAAVHAIAHLMNQTLGNAGTTVTYTDPVVADPSDQLEGLRALAADLDAGQVDVLIILEGNPVYDAPADLGFKERLAKAALRAHLSLYNNETTQLCQWKVPAAHYMEAWGDARAFDGTATIIQPMIAPLYDGRTPSEVIDVINGKGGRATYDIVQETWKPQAATGFDAFWQKAVREGTVPDSALKPVQVTARPLAGQVLPRPTAPAEALEIVYLPAPNLYDGRFAPNAWLQETPDPTSKLVWDNAAFISPRLAEHEGLRNGDVVELSYRGGTVQAPVFIQPGQAENSVSVYLGYGRSSAGPVAQDVGFDAYAIRAANPVWFDAGLEMHALGTSYALATTQMQHTLVGRNLVRSATLEEFVKEPEFAHDEHHYLKARGEISPAAAAAVENDFSMYPGHWKYPGYAWAMTIDLGLCIGCNACVSACQSENNIPVVGKGQVQVGRVMQWLKIDQYYTGSAENPESYFQPRPCMQCENAPCEPVCPVAATVHSADGLNDMAYNRCIGTRYCSNNCPYKVRRFNYLQYTDYNAPSVLRMVHNPEVSVRSRGVMEKCTYCVQRIRAADITARREGRVVRDGEVMTACQTVCPTAAITFGNMNDPDSAVAKSKESPLNYGMLQELNTRPRTTYLAAIRNPNPELVEQHG